MPAPQLSKEGAASIDKFLREAVARKHIPALFLGATNQDEEIYYNQAGLMRFAEEDSGEVNKDTGKSTLSLNCVAIWRCKPSEA
jgi:hypothetical protein